VTRKTTNVDIGNGKVRARTRIEGDACEQGTFEARHSQYTLLSAIGATPDLTACALVAFEKLTMYHNGTSWVVEAEAIVDDPQGLLNASTPTNSAGIALRS
jgi:hypothetical protein